MKNNALLKPFTVIAVMLLVAMAFFNGSAQTLLASNSGFPRHHAETSGEDLSLGELLQYIEKVHDVSFLCKSDLLKVRLETRRENFAGSGFDRNLEYVLQRYGMKMMAVTPRQYAISRDGIRHLQQISFNGDSGQATASGGNYRFPSLVMPGSMPLKNYAETRLAAERPVSGTVTDHGTGALLTGVSVSVKGTTTGTTTDAKGHYSLQVDDPNAVLVFTYIGYNKQEISLRGQSVLNVGLTQNATALNQVVVVGYGTQKKANLTGAVTQVGSKMMEDRPLNNVGAALQGVIPNLNINFSDGHPGAASKVNIRGYTSVNGGLPLILVDGVPGDIDMVNPADVATVTVLKDASSAAIYGSRASQVSAVF